MGTEGAFDLLAVDLTGTGPTFERAEHDRGPAGAGDRAAAISCVAPDLLDRRVALVERAGQGFVHRRRFAALDEVRLIARPFEEPPEVGVVGAAEHGGPAD